jgi:hypothetical protein
MEGRSLEQAVTRTNPASIIRVVFLIGLQRYPRQFRGGGSIGKMDYEIGKKKRRLRKRRLGKRRLGKRRLRKKRLREKKADPFRDRPGMGNGRR